jgi:hypothetical protein
MFAAARSRVRFETFTQRRYNAWPLIHVGNGKGSVGMSRGKQRFTITEVRRALKVPQEMGLQIRGYRIEIGPDDRPAIVVDVYVPNMDISKDSGVSSWDSIIRNLEGQTNGEA